MPYGKVSPEKPGVGQNPSFGWVDVGKLGALQWWSTAHQALPGHYLGGECGPCQPAPGLSPGSDRAGGNSLCSPLCTAEGALRSCFLGKSEQFLWLEGGPGPEQAMPCWVSQKGASNPRFFFFFPPSRAILLTRVKITTQILALPFTNCKLGQLAFLCLNFPSEKCGLALVWLS